jgi:hypothetical protein
MSNCNKLVKTVDVEMKPCLCVLGHAGGCNPFSPNPYMAALISKKELPKGDRMPLGAVEVNGVVWTNQSVTRRCLWQGPNGRCIYELGNHTKHKEESQHGN